MSATLADSARASVILRHAAQHCDTVALGFLLPREGFMSLRPVGYRGHDGELWYKSYAESAEVLSMMSEVIMPWEVNR